MSGFWRRYGLVKTALDAENLEKVGFSLSGIGSAIGSTAANLWSKTKLFGNQIKSGFNNNIGHFDEINANNLLAKNKRAEAALVDKQTASVNNLKDAEKELEQANQAAQQATQATTNAAGAATNTAANTAASTGGSWKRYAGAGAGGLVVGGGAVAAFSGAQNVAQPMPSTPPMQPTFPMQ